MVFLKPARYFLYLRVCYDHDACIGCLKCIEACPTHTLNIKK